MSLQKEPRDAAEACDADPELADAGWDPYVAELLSGNPRKREASADDGEDSAPVMTLQRPRGRP